MKVFLSWSGPTSKAIAEALRDWLPILIQDAEPWMSDADVDAGARWGLEVAKQLAETSVGIICMTPDNISAPWLQFEAGALSKTLDKTRVIPYLFNLTPGTLKGPLTQFQAATADKPGTKKLVQAINRARASKKRSLSDARLEKIFDTWWPNLEQNLKRIGPEITNESAYTFYYKVFGLAYENLVIHATLDEDGSMSVRRQSRLTAYLNTISTLDQYLITDARQGTIDVAQVECLFPSSTVLSPRIQKATADSLTLLIDIAPPLTEGESVEFAVVEQTPPSAITRTYEEMMARSKPYPYECFFWDITRPTKRLEMKVLIPKALAPQSAEPGVWWGPSRITSEQEIRRIEGAFKRGSSGGSYEELSLDVTYPVPGLRYAIKWVPRQA